MSWNTSLLNPQRLLGARHRWFFRAGHQRHLWMMMTQTACIGRDACHQMWRGVHVYPVGT